MFKQPCQPSAKQSLYRGWLPTDFDAFFNFSLFVKFIRTKQNFQNRTGLSIPVNLNASKRKEGKSQCL